MIEKRKPWNAFPLASLSVRGVSACAADVLRYLAIRSDWQGSTIVGQRRMWDDMNRSKGYVTAGLKELEEKKLLTTVGRKRADKQADRRIISKSILSPEYQALIPSDNPKEQEDSNSDNTTGKENCRSNNPNLESNLPTEQEDNLPTICSNIPTQQDETLQIEPCSLNSNLAGLEPESQNQVSQSVSQPPREAEPPADPESVLRVLVERYGKEALGLVEWLHPLCDLRILQRELPFVDNVTGCLPEGVDAFDLLEYNHAHKKGGLYIRSWEQFWVKVLGEGESLYMVNDYATHESEHCKDCRARGLVSWTKKQEQRAEAVRQEAEAMEQERLAQEQWEFWTQLEFRTPTPEEQREFKTVRGTDGWLDRRLSRAIDSGGQEWAWKNVGAAILYVLQHRRSEISFDAFAALAARIAKLAARPPEKPLVKVQSQSSPGRDG